MDSDMLAPKKTNSKNPSENRLLPQERMVFQASIFRGKLFALG